MAKIYESIKSLITANMVKNAGLTLDESHTKIAAGVDVLLPSLLAKLLKKGNSDHVEGVVAEAAKLKVDKHIPQLFEGHGILQEENVGERMENALLGEKENEFISAIAAKTGLKHESANRLSNWVSGTIAAFFSSKTLNGGQSYKSLLTELGKEKESLKAHIPANLLSILGLGSLFGASTTAHKAAGRVEAPRKKKKGGGWIWWLLIILLLLALLFFWWRSCDRKKAEQELAQKAAIEKAEAEAAAAAHAAKEAWDPNRDVLEHKLPNGEVVKFYKDDYEQHMLAFLDSDKYKKATDKDLRLTWFVLDNIEFKHDSATEFEPGSKKHLDNLLTIMKGHPAAKLDIGGLADATGGKIVNLEISKERANFIKSYLGKNGIDAARITTEGFGKEFASLPATASEKARAIDRIVAVRFVK